MPSSASIHTTLALSLPCRCSAEARTYRVPVSPPCAFFFFFNDTATTEIYTLSLHDALPISPHSSLRRTCPTGTPQRGVGRDRKSTRLNSSHGSISYAVFCLNEKNNAGI